MLNYPYKLKIYQSEWVTQLFWVTDRGFMQDIIYEKSWPTQEEAKSDLERIATPSPYLSNVWMGERDYQQAHVIYREIEIKPPYNKVILDELLLEVKCVSE